MREYLGQLDPARGVARRFVIGLRGQRTVRARSHYRQRVAAIPDIDGFQRFHQGIRMLCPVRKVEKERRLALRLGRELQEHPTTFLVPVAGFVDELQAINGSRRHPQRLRGRVRQRDDQAIAVLRVRRPNTFIITNTYSAPHTEQIAPDDYAYYRICFNENGVLNVLANSLTPQMVCRAPKA